MKAWLSHVAGGPETLELNEVTTPEPGPGEVRIRVAAVSINYPDVLIIEDKYQDRPDRPFSPGAELAGVIDAVGPGVDDFSVGQRVAAAPGSGALAEAIVMPARSRMCPIPEGMPDDVAGALLVTYGTSYHALAERAELRAGQTMLVLGAAGGVGLAAIELGKALGARVVAATSSEERAAICRQRGADEAIIYGRPPFDNDGKKALGRQIREAVGPGGADVIYDPVGGEYAEPALRNIAWDGRYLVVGFTAGIAAMPMNLLLLKNCRMLGVYWGLDAERRHENFLLQMNRLFELWEQGKISPAISRRYPFERAPDAIADMAARNSFGKLVVEVGDFQGPLD